MEKGFLEINPKDANKLGILGGEKVKAISRRGEISIEVLLTERMDEGVVFLPFHFAESAANVITNPAFDPVAKIPEYKVCAVRIEKIDEKKEG